jgi:hypothetical protein
MGRLNYTADSISHILGDIRFGVNAIARLVKEMQQQEQEQEGQQS